MRPRRRRPARFSLMRCGCRRSPASSTKPMTDLETLPIKTSQAYYQDAVVPLGQYLLGQGMVEEGRRYRDRLLTPEFLAGLPETTPAHARRAMPNFMMWLAEDEAHWFAALGALAQDRYVAPQFPAGQGICGPCRRTTDCSPPAERALLSARPGRGSMRAAGRRRNPSPRNCLRSIRSSRQSPTRSRPTIPEAKRTEPPAVNHPANAALWHPGQALPASGSRSR